MQLTQLFSVDITIDMISKIQAVEVYLRTRLLSLGDVIRHLHKLSGIPSEVNAAKSYMVTPRCALRAFQAEEESCSQWDRLSGHRCGRLPNHSSARAASRSQEPELRARAKRNRERDRPTSNLHPSTNNIMESDSGGTPLLLKSSSRGPRHSPAPHIKQKL